MSQRTVAVVLKAQVENYLANMTAAEKRTLEVEQALKTTTQRFADHNRALEAAGRGLAIGGAAVAVGIGLAVKASAEYGAKLAQLQSLSHASQADMQRMSAAAMTQGTAFGQSAAQVADAEIELTKAGRETAQILGGDLKGALALAAAGQMDVAQATQIGVTAVTQFAKSGATIPHVADLLAAGADKALGSVGDLGAALNQGGLVAAQMGLSVDQTVGTLSAFAQAGLLGSDAGTSFKTMLLSLQSPSQQAKKYLDEYNISAYNQEGAFVGITNLAGQLQKAFKDKSQADRDAALSTIFGTDAIRAANVLYEQGATGIQDWTDKVNVSGFAAQQAAGKLNSLQGDAQKLAAAFQTDLVKAGASADGSLRGVVQTATSLVTAAGQIPAPMQNGIMAAAALTAGVGLLGGAFLLGVPKIAAFRAGLRDMNVTGRQAAGIFGKGTALIVGVAALAEGLSAAGIKGQASAQQVASAGVAIAGGFKDVDKAFSHVHNGIQDVHGLKAALDTLGPGLSESSVAKFFDSLTSLGGINPIPTHLADTYKANEQTLDAMGQQLATLAQKSYPEASRSFAGLVAQYKLGKDEQAALLANMPAYRDELTKIAQHAGISASDQNLLNLAQGKGAGSAKVLARAYTEAQVQAAKQAAATQNLAGSAINAAVDISTLEKTIEGFGSAQLDARSATRAMYQAIDDATAAAKKNGSTLDEHTQKGRDNQAALDGIASAASAAAAKTLEQTGSTKKAADVMQHGRDAFLRAADAMGLGGDKAKALADKLGLIPSNIRVAVKADGFDEAKNALKNLQAKLDGLRSKKITVQVATQIEVANSQIRVAAMAASGVDYFGNPIKRAMGGQIDGRGPKGVDSVPALLAPGEHVWTSHEVDAAGGQGAVYRIRAAAASGTLRGYATGGAIGQGREDFVSAQRRAYGSPIDPMSYVDQLRSMSRDDNFSGSRRRSFDRAANGLEGALVRLQVAGQKASQKLDDLRSSSDQMRSSIRSSIAGGYTLTGAASSLRASGTFQQNGMSFTSYSSGPTAAGIASYYKAGAGETKTFAANLKALAGKGLNPALLAEIAGYGVAQGAPIAAALLSASSAQIRSINAGYTSIGKNADTAGKTVADDNYARQIKTANANASKITRQIAVDGEKLRKLIARAFGLKGYATGTSSAEGGIRWVGEQGPELVGFGGGERVLTASDSSRWIAGGGGSGGGKPIRVQVALPQSMDLVDAGGGLITTVGVIARDVAVREIAADALNDAALMAGGAA